jgi:hypothetical protein
MLPDTIQALQKRLKGLLSSVEDQTNATVSNMSFLDLYIEDRFRKLGVNFHFVAVHGS